jgi:hypothetical protein
MIVSIVWLSRASFQCSATKPERITLGRVHGDGRVRIYTKELCASRIIVLHWRVAR